MISKVFKNVSPDTVKILLIVLTVVLCLLGSLSVLVVKFLIEEEAAFREVNHLSNCSVFCEDLSLSPYEDYETFNVRNKQIQTSLHNDRYVCSTKNITKIISQIVERTGRLRLSKGEVSKQYLQCGNENLREKSNSQVASFRRIDHHRQFKSEKDQVIYWHKHAVSTFISEELHYHNGELKVPETRVYFVYTSVLINGSCADNRRGDVCNYYVRICARGRWSERILLQKMGVYNSTDESFITSLHIGTHVLLQRHDAVFVRISDASRLIPESAGNVFGIMPMR
ncbi:CD40 ligand-like isoform X2 [Ruditapes philippinarum]|uniref:CD40 ligand-like isoform X2 n=1 Tax=Ruditapes philippinarum TaxID=129788 RepID=UPI00295B7D88|nr:CD40 ligand-like isoform X2 [Ruditapes philippinarum]